jgi:hypothetical protein
MLEQARKFLAGFDSWSCSTGLSTEVVDTTTNTMRSVRRSQQKTPALVRGTGVGCVVGCQTDSEVSASSTA